MDRKKVAGNASRGYLVTAGVNEYEGSRPARRGKFEYKTFRMRRAQAIEAWEEWNAAGFEALAAEDVRRKSVEKKAREIYQQEPAGKTYALVVVGGAPLYTFRSLDKAAAVCDALTDAAKASGFAAKYDVVEMREWPEQ